MGKFKMTAEWNDKHAASGQWDLLVGDIEVATVLAEYDRDHNGDEYVSGWSWSLGESEFPWWDERDGRTEGRAESREKAMTYAQEAVGKRLAAVLAALNGMNLCDESTHG